LAFIMNVKSCYNCRKKSHFPQFHN
jgi:hypothetical protein